MKISLNHNLSFDKRVLDDPEIDDETKKNYLFEMSQGFLCSETIARLSEKEYFQIEEKEEVISDKKDLGNIEKQNHQQNFISPQQEVEISGKLLEEDFEVEEEPEEVKKVEEEAPKSDFKCPQCNSPVEPYKDCMNPECKAEIIWGDK